MGQWESSIGKSDDWYTPAYVFEGLGCTFDLDPAHPEEKTHVPCAKFYSSQGLQLPWEGFVWLNPPYGGRNGIIPWLARFFAHGNGIVLTPDRTSAPWWQAAARRADAILFVSGKIKFIRPDGSLGKEPANGTTLMAAGERGEKVLKQATKLGVVMLRN